MSVELGDAVAAEVAFYRALAEGDYALMAQVWDEADDVGCVHPGWPALHGREAVLASFKRMFDAGQRLDLRVERVLARPFGEGVLHLAHEFVAHAGESAAAAPIVATNLYRPTAGRWHLLWHHASPTPVLETASGAVH